MKILIRTMLLFTAAIIIAISAVNRPGNTGSTALPVPSSTPSQTVTPTPIPVTRAPTPLPTVKIIPSSGNITTSNELNSTVNEYRSANGRSTLTIHNTLCRIAATRVNQQAQAGSLDKHAGFQAQSESQKEFLHLGEILQYRSPQATVQYLVYTGWAGSGEHNSVLLDPGWTHGCGSISGLYAVFIFGRN